MAKNLANAKQHAEVELLTYENYWHSSSTLSTRNNRKYPKKISKGTSASDHHNENKDENDKKIT